MATRKPVIVVIPGAFHRPSHYDPIILPLREQGYTVISPPLVTCGDVDVSAAALPADDAKRVHEDLLPLLDQGLEAVVVAHSYGSVVATETIRDQTRAERASRGLPGGIVGAVWIAGFCFPTRGKNITGGDDKIPPTPYQTLKDGLLSLTEDAKPVFYSGLSPELADAAFTSLCKFQSHAAFHVCPDFIASDITVPKTYLLCESDQAVPPAYQQVMIEFGKFQKVVRLASGHSPFLGMPGRVVDEIVQVCDQGISEQL
ncbi:Alpha/beta hydrolase fold-1 [Echria macrotheca]|uniref:Alpha/beta hydrolase fold-1 n=1 Tax=Echria macrotheca TaxID=438768 RepID=A0AAJ0F5C0_9PEZI|nr:Alpha/beta hydrolase fold-1 [Echria macrotheca]